LTIEQGLEYTVGMAAYMMVAQVGESAVSGVSLVCPRNLAIPHYFAVYNSISNTTGSFSSHMVYYNNIAINHGKASDCIGCRQCEKACPQHLPITGYLKDVVEKFERISIIPTKQSRKGNVNNKGNNRIFKTIS
jgi:predicted aldo/keto reductase-like oxidoreductase